MARWPAILLVSLGIGAAGCGDDDGGTTGTDAGPNHGDAGPRADAGPPPMLDGGNMGLDGGSGPPMEPPSTVTRVTHEGFASPSAAAVSPDGATVYFAAYLPSGEPALFSVPSTGTDVVPVVVHMGNPLQYVLGLALSADGTTLFVADAAAGANGDGAVFSVATSGGATSMVAVTGIRFPTGIALDRTGENLVLAARDAETSAWGVFRAPVAGGAAVPVVRGTPLMSPSGVYVDPRHGTTYVLDHLAVGANGQGVLFQIAEGAAAATEVASGLRLGTPAGVTLTAGGGTLLIASRTRSGAGSLVTVDVTSGTVGTAAAATASMIADPSGIAVARASGVFAIVDSEGNAIFSAR